MSRSSSFWLWCSGAVALWLLCGAVTLVHSGLQLAWVTGSLAALSTALGSIPALATVRLRGAVTDALQGFGAGIMLAAAGVALVLPAVEMLSQQWGTWPGSLAAGLMILVGGGGIAVLEKLMPHGQGVPVEPLGTRGRVGSDQVRRMWLFVFAITLHNIPEGLAIGVASSGQGLEAAAVTLGIALQDAPEGLVVALALIQAGYARRYAVAVAVLSGLVEPVAAVVGGSAVLAVAGLLPWTLALAGGAMVFVVSHEIIPESHSQGNQAQATLGLMIGFASMIVLDSALG